jgi:hypothetical protein
LWGVFWIGGIQATIEYGHADTPMDYQFRYNRYLKAESIGAELDYRIEMNVLSDGAAFELPL